MTIGIGTGWRFSKGEAPSAKAEASPTTSLSTSPPTNFFRQFNLRFLPTIVKGGFYHKLAAYGDFGRPDLEILPWEEIDRATVLQAAKI